MADIRKRPGLPPALLWVGYLALTAGSALLADSLMGQGAGMFRHVAVASGAAALAMVLLQMVTSGRLERLSGRLGIDVTMGFHRWAAPVALGFALLHVVLLPGGPDPAHPGRFGGRLIAILTAPGLVDARLALLLLVLVVGFALLRDRLPGGYEVWRAGHLAMALALVSLLLAHVLTDTRGARGWAGPWWILFCGAAIAPGIWGYGRRLLGRSGEGWSVDCVRRVGDGLWELTVVNRSGRTLGFRAGQFAWLAVGKHRLPLFDHPFSMASPPRDGGTLRFLVREAGDFTRQIGAVTAGTRVGLDAPHGSFGLRADDTGPLLLIAGGVGVAPILSILVERAAQGAGAGLRLIYAVRSPEAVVDETLWRKDLEAAGGTVLVLADHPGGAEGVEQGPLTLDHLRRMLEGWDPAQVTALLCGPDGMMTRASDRLEDLGLDPRRIRYERFDYSSSRLSRRDRRYLGAFIGLWAGCLLVTVIAAFT